MILLNLQEKQFALFSKLKNIKVRGKVKEGKLSDYKNTRKILNYKSQSIAKLTKDFLLYSSNYMTDMLVSTLGAHTKSKNLPENRYQAGLKSVQDLLPKRYFQKVLLSLSVALD